VGEAKVGEEFTKHEFGGWRPSRAAGLSCDRQPRRRSNSSQRQDDGPGGASGPSFSGPGTTRDENPRQAAIEMQGAMSQTSGRQRRAIAAPHDTVKQSDPRRAAS
jgi:hypothetical protein